MTDAEAPPFRILPNLDDLNRFFWTSGADGRLRFLRCQDCKQYIHPPQPRCPACLSTRVEPEVVSGRATLFSYTVNHQPWVPNVPVPYVIGLVEIVEQEGVRLTTNIVDCDPEALQIGMPLEVTFEAHGEIHVPLFRPA